MPSENVHLNIWRSNTSKLFLDPLALSRLRCSYSIAGFLVTFSFPLRFKTLLSCAFKAELKQGLKTRELKWFMIRGYQYLIKLPLPLTIDRIFFYAMQRSFTMKVYAEFNDHQIARKCSLKLLQCITNLKRLIPVCFFFLVRLRVPSAFAHTSDSTAVRLKYHHHQILYKHIFIISYNLGLS